MAEKELHPVSIADLLALVETMMEKQNAQHQEAMRLLVSEIKKPLVDPVREAQKAREQEMKVRNLKEYWAKKEAKKRNCLHSRQDGTCVIAWATQSDGVRRGYCPNCDSTFTPEDGDLYITQARRPTGLMESVRYIA